MRHVYRFLLEWISQNEILTIILILAAILRFGGIYPGYPLTHSDEGAIYSTAVKMIKKLTLDPMRYDYAALPMILHAAVYLIFNPIFIIFSFIFAPDNLPRFKNILDFYGQILWLNLQTAVIFWGRFITACFGIGIVFMVYQVAIKFFNKKAIGLVAAFLTAVNFRQVLNSHLTLPDIYNAFFLLLCFYTFANLLRKPDKKNYLLSGIIIGLYFSVKFHVFAILTFIFIHFINTWVLVKKHNLQSIIKNKNVLFRNLVRFDFIISVLLILVTFIIVNPYLFLNWDAFIAINKYQALQYRLGINNLDFFPISYYYHIGIGEITSIFILLGIIWGLKKYTRSTFLLLSTIVPFFYILDYYGNGGFYTRNFVTITPLLLIFAGLFLVEICMLISQKFKLGKNATYGLIVLLLITIALGQIKNSILNTFYFSLPSNMKSAKIWAQNNIPDGTTIAARTIDKFAKKKKFKIVNYEFNDVFSLAEMQEKGVEYGYIPLDELNVFFYWWMRESTKLSWAYWDKNVPDSISQNMYAAKVAKELASWSVAAFIKPWQAPDQNYFIVKVPKKLEIQKKKIIKIFSFDIKDSLCSWFLIRGSSKQVENINFDLAIGHLEKGAVRIDKSVAYPSIVRVVSPIIPLTEGKAYELTGWIKLEDILNEREKDGYLMIDFYEDDPKDISLTTRSFSSSLSSRVFGTTAWTEKKITVIAPQNAKFMTISLAIYEPNITTIWFDDITLAESEDNFEDPRTQPPHLNYYKIPQNIIFPVSHGNL